MQLTNGNRIRLMGTCCRNGGVVNGLPRVAPSAS